MKTIALVSCLALATSTAAQAQDTNERIRVYSYMKDGNRYYSTMPPVGGASNVRVLRATGSGTEWRNAAEEVGSGVIFYSHAIAGQELRFYNTYAPYNEPYVLCAGEPCEIRKNCKSAYKVEAITKSGKIAARGCYKLQRTEARAFFDNGEEWAFKLTDILPTALWCSAVNSTKGRCTNAPQK